MKCFHFSNGEKKEEDDGAISRVSRVSWARSLSIASSSVDVRRSEFGSESRDFSDSLSFHDFFSQRRPNDLRVFSFSELRSVTRGFSRALMIGEGGFGSVYRAVVRVSDDDPDAKMDVAIKQLNRNGLQVSDCKNSMVVKPYRRIEAVEEAKKIMVTPTRQGDLTALDALTTLKNNYDVGHKEWITEVNYLGVVKHPNLVRLVGYCAEDDERGIQRLLVYELMRNKSLEDHLLARMPSSLPWELRLKIALDAARGLAYLHEEMDFQLIFRDFKSSNILLDEDFNAKLSDFGLARLGPTEGLGHVSTSVVGTVGYAAPEYIQTGRLTAKSDVWSFGVVLYELITGRRSVDRNLPRSEQKLLEWVKPYLSDSKKFHLILDIRLEGSSCIKSAQKLASLANKCLMKHPKSRPKMSEVVEMLGQIIAETSSALDGGVPQSIKETETVKEDNVAENESTKPGGSYLKRVFYFKEIVSLRNRSGGKLDWRNWTPGLVRTW